MRALSAICKAIIAKGGHELDFARWVWRSIGRHRIAALKVTSISLCAGCVYLILPLMIEQMIRLLSNPAQTNLLAYAVVSVGLSLAALRWLNGFMSTTIIAAILADIRDDLIERLILLTPGQINAMGPAEVTARILSDGSRLANFCANLITSAPKSILLVFGSLIYLLIYQAQFSLFLLLLTLVIYVPAVFFGRKLIQITQKWQALQARLAARLNELFAGLREIQSYSQEQDKLKELQDLNKTIAVTAKRYGALRETGPTIATVMVSLALAIYLALVGVPSGVALSEVGALLVVAGLLVTGVLGVMEIYTEGAAAKGAFATLNNYSQMTSAVSEPQNAINLIAGNGTVVLEFRRVEFRYPDTSNLVLEHAEFQLCKGDRLGLMGASGSGKSTILQLSQRFYDPLAGEILLNSAPIRLLSLPDLRSQITYVTQEPVIFSASIRENLRLAAPNASDEELWNALDIANAANFVAQFPEGLDRILIDRGNNLSLGQRQRIAIARSCLKNAPIVLLDEPTASLDQEAERFVLSALDGLLQDRSAIIVSHKPTTMFGCKTVLTLKEGRLY